MGVALNSVVAPTVLCCVGARSPDLFSYVSVSVLPDSFLFLFTLQRVAAMMWLKYVNSIFLYIYIYIIYIYIIYIFYVQLRNAASC